MPEAAAGTSRAAPRERVASAPAITRHGWGTAKVPQPCGVGEAVFRRPALFTAPRPRLDDRDRPPRLTTPFDHCV